MFSLIHHILVHHILVHHHTSTELLPWYVPVHYDVLPIGLLYNKVLKYGVIRLEEMWKNFFFFFFYFLFNVSVIYHHPPTYMPAVHSLQSWINHGICD